MDSDVQNLIYLLAALILPVSALAGRRLNWKKGLVMALVWGSIFVGATLFMMAVTG